MQLTSHMKLTLIEGPHTVTLSINKAKNSMHYGQFCQKLSNNSTKFCQICQILKLSTQIYVDFDVYVGKLTLK